MSRILVVNTGSSSLKLTVLDADDPVPVAAVHVPGWDGHDVAPVGTVVAGAGPVAAVGHRVVHGGAELTDPTLIDDAVEARIEALVPLAPLHQDRALAGIVAARAAAPELPQVACFDTAFHAAMPAAAAIYALPAAWRQRWDLRRFGFHGLSHAHAAGRAAAMVGRPDDPDLRVVSCHLGAGASLAAIRGGRSVDTTMGFTPLEGLVMATRSGSVDPGLLLWLLTDAGLTAAEVRDGLEHDAGLAGLAGTADMKAVVERLGPGDGDETARLAFDVYVHRLAREVAAMTAALGGVDVLVFTGGVGEHSAEVRQAATDRLPHLGIALDPDLNAAEPQADTRDRDLTAPDAPVTTLVVEAREDLEIARQVRTVLDGAPAPPL